MVHPGRRREAPGQDRRPGRRPAARQKQNHLHPHADCGDNVIIINAGKAVLTGKKGEQKIYRTHSGWVGGLKETPYRILMQEKPEVAMRVAVRGMMPKNTVAKDSLKRLHIYAGAEHKQQAQKPIALDAE